MSSPQVENGYVRIATELQEALCSIRICGEARQVFDVVIRKTYGFNKKEDAISLSQFCLMTGMKKTSICKAIDKLCKMNLITKKGNDIANIYSIQKDFSTWKPLPKKETLPKKEMGGTPKRKLSLPKKGHTIDNNKRQYTKDISATSAETPFSFKEEEAKWKTDARKHIRVVGWYFTQKDLWRSFVSARQAGAAAKQHFRAAQTVVEGEWTPKDLLAAKERMRDENPDLWEKNSWTLSTLLKYLSK